MGASSNHGGQVQLDCRLPPGQVASRVLFLTLHHLVLIDRLMMTLVFFHCRARIFLCKVREFVGDCELIIYPIDSNAKSLLFDSLLCMPGNT